MKYTPFIFFFSFFLSCKVTQPISKDYFPQKRKIGIYFDSPKAKRYKEGPRGLLDMAVIKFDNKYRYPLGVINNNIILRDSLERIYTDVLKTKGVEFVLIDRFVDESQLLDTKPKSRSKKYTKKDYRYLKATYEIDDLLYLKSKHGIKITYYGTIETKREGFCYIESAIINLTDNSYHYKGSSSFGRKLGANWNDPPEFNEILIAVKETIKSALIKEQTKFVYF